MTNELKVAAIVVTFNKVAFLSKNIEHLLNQDTTIEEIIIVDNASTDDTETYMTSLAANNPKINYQRLTKNIGGAGGFSHGIKTAFDNPVIDYAWVMDDDTMPRNNSLTTLLDAAHNRLADNFGFLVSNTRWTDGHAALMNVPETTSDWNDRVADNLVGIKTGTFVSFMTSRKVVSELGLPIKEFFIWSDDLEFSSRISKRYPSYLVTDSLVDHEMAKNQGVKFLEETDVNRLGRYTYSFRNKMYIERRDGHKGYLRYKVSLLLLMLTLPFKSVDFKWQKERILLKGFNQGLFFKPTVEFLNKR